MSKKEYIRIAAALRWADPAGQDVLRPDLQRAGWLRAVSAIADALAEENPRFDTDRFYDACHVMPDHV